MQEQLASFELSTLALSKGFNHMRANCYGDNKAYQLPDGELINALRGNTVTGYVLAPTLSLLAKWLRDDHEIHIVISKVDGRNRNYMVTLDPENHSHYPAIILEFEEYEDALAVGITKALTLVPKV